MAKSVKSSKNFELLGNNLSSKDIEKKLPFNFCSSVAAALTKRLFPVPTCPYKSIVFHGARLPSNN